MLFLHNILPTTEGITYITLNTAVKEILGRASVLVPRKEQLTRRVTGKYFTVSTLGLPRSPQASVMTEAYNNTWERRSVWSTGLPSLVKDF